MSSPFDHARQLYESWEAAETSAARQALEDELAQFDERTNDSTGEPAYLRGLIAYEPEFGYDPNSPLGELSLDELSIALQLFERALQLNPNHYMARMYAAHCLHDQKHYAEALLEYEQVDVERLRADYPLWRYVKWLELKAECLMRTERKEEALALLAQVLEYYETEPPEALAYPVEALRCLPPEHPMARRLLALQE
ncbi:MAG: tetratricopeptide repeat protein [Bacteroidota bacterium]